MVILRRHAFRTQLPGSHVLVAYIWFCFQRKSMSYPTQCTHMIEYSTMQYIVSRRYNALPPRPVPQPRWFGWWGEMSPTRVEWRSTMRGSGVLYVMTAGMIMTPLWRVLWWDTAQVSIVDILIDLNRHMAMAQGMAVLSLECSKSNTTALHQTIDTSCTEL